MTDHGHEVSFGYFLIPNADDPLLPSPSRSNGSVWTTWRPGPPLPAPASSTPGRCCVIAAATERIGLFPDVASLPLRPPAMMAKAAASLDLLSGGRVELGLGAGGFWDAIEAYGGPRRDPERRWPRWPRRSR